MDEKELELMIVNATKEQLKWLLSSMESKEGLKRLRELIEMKISKF